MTTNPKKILVAEDEKPIARALELKLTHSGYTVTVVHDGESAIAELEKEAFDLVILDLMMPKKNGFQVLTAMKEKGITTPTLVASNLSMTEDVKKVLELGARDYFIKSNTPLAEIVLKIEELLSA